MTRSRPGRKTRPPPVPAGAAVQGLLHRRAGQIRTTTAVPTVIQAAIARPALQVIGTRRN